MRMVHARERDHSEAVREGREVLLQFVRRTARRDELNFVEVEAAISGAGYGKMAIVNRIEGAAKNRYAAGMVFCGGAVRLRCGQSVSVEEACWLFCGGSCSKSSAEWLSFGILSRVSAIARTRSLTPVPEAAEME